MVIIGQNMLLPVESLRMTILHAMLKQETLLNGDIGMGNAKFCAF
jgi:hypothetical protein